MKQSILILIIILIFSINIKEAEIIKNNTIESINRRIYAFNRGIDYVLITPATKIYVNIMPKFMVNCIDNFIKNSEEMQNLAIYFKILKRDEFNYYLSRMIINSTFGLFGFFDVAKKVNKPRKNYDLNKIFLFHESQYMVLPIIGPGTFKINLFLLITQVLNPYIYFFNNIFIFYFIEIINKKSNITFDNMFFHKNMIDSYSFLKDIYIQSMIKENNDENFLEEPPE